MYSAWENGVEKNSPEEEKSGGGGSFSPPEHDALSGLLNRSGFNARVRALIDAHPDEAYVLVYGDIDRFKAYNDLFGTPAGDSLLADIGEMIQQSLPSDAVAARLRADHFIGCFPQALFDPDRMLAVLNKWFDSYRQDFTFFVRMGVYPIDDPELDVNLMCDRALLALRAAKGGSVGSKYVQYDETLRASLLKEQQLAGEMTAALDQGQFVPFFQPQYRYATGCMTGAEVLARWQHPERGLLGPSEFIPVFERNGLIARFDYYIWDQACQCLRAWIDTWGINAVPHLSVNLSRSDIYRSDLCSYLKSLVARYEVPSNLLNLEITESSYMESPEQLIEVVEALRAAGFTVEMDDFGSGYSSLNTLKDVPVDVLKLDMGFLDARDSTRGGLILASVVRMARWLDLPTIAEGVETPEQAAYLASIGCECMQGYLFSRPVDRATFEGMISEGGLDVGDCAAREDVQYNANELWNADSLAALVFNGYVGAAAIAEFDNRTLEIVRANRAFADLFGMPGDFATAEQLHKDMLSQLIGEDRAALQEALCQAVGGEGDAESELCYRSDGRSRWIRLRIRLLSRTDDLSNLYLLAEETTQEQVVRDRLAATGDSEPYGIVRYAVKDNPQMLFINKKGCEIFGYSGFDAYRAERGEVKLAPIHDDDKAQHDETVEALKNGAPPIDFTYKIVRRDGTVGWIEGTAALEREADGHTFIQSAFLDVSDRQQKRYEQDIRRYATVLCSAYDEILEFDKARNTYRSLYLEGRSSIGPTMPLEKALRFWTGRMPDAEDRVRLRNALDECLEDDSGNPITLTYRMEFEDRRCWYQNTLLRVSETGILCCGKDVTESLSNEDRKVVKRVRDIMGRLPVGVGVFTLHEGEVLMRYANDRLRSMFGDGLSFASEGTEHGALPVLTGEAKELRDRCVERGFIEDGGELDVSLRTSRQDGEPIDVRIQGRVMCESDDALALYAVLSDVTAELRDQRERSWQNERYRLLSEMTHKMSFDYDSDSDTVLLYMDRTGRGMEAQVINHYLESLAQDRCGIIHPESIQDVRKMFEDALPAATGRGIEYRANYYGTGYSWYRASLFVAHDEAGAQHLAGLIENINDVRDLRFRAEYDATTGLSNHATTKDLVTAALSDVLVREHSVCVALDIDDFKQVNDTYGHIVGDALLHEVGSVLRSSFRETDVVGRVGGDEFVLLLKNVDLDIALGKLEQVGQRLSIVKVGSSGRVPSVSMGVYVPQSADAAYHDVFVKADEALYRAKRSGKNCICVHERR